MDEWKEARGILARFDNNLHDLRKYSFTFITALLAANGLLSQSNQDAYVPPIKATVLFATLGLIVGVKLLDQHYRLYEQAASLRARMLEARLDLDITTDIAIYYDVGSWWKYIQGLYYALVLLAGMVGVAILWHTGWVVWILIAVLVSVSSVWVIDRSHLNAMADWSVDRFVLKSGEPVRITFTNLDPANKENFKDSAKSVASSFRLHWRITEYAKPSGAIIKEDGQAASMPVEQFVVKDRLDIDDLYYLGAREWLWKAEVPEGLYLLEMEAQKVGTKTGTNPVKFEKDPTPHPPHNVDIVVQVN
jgi:hypothetical protein